MTVEEENCIATAAATVEEFADCLVQNHFAKLQKKHGSDYFNFWGNVSFANLTSSSLLSKGQRIILEKFLIAQEWKIAESVEMFLATLSWRSKNNVSSGNGGFSSSDISSSNKSSSHISSSNKSSSVSFLDKVGFTFGRDRMGNPVTYNMYGALDVESLFAGRSDEEGVDLFIRWRVKLMEKALSQIDFDQCDGQEHSKITQVSTII